MLGFITYIVTGKWTGAGLFSLKSDKDQSTILYNSWPSMKYMFRAVLRRKRRLLEMKDKEENKKRHVIVYGACSHMG